MSRGGKRPGSGRKPGTPNKITHTIRSAIENAFTNLQGDPKACLHAWGKANPTEFYRLAARLISHEVKNEVQFSNVDVSNFTDDELVAIAAGKVTNEVITRLIAFTPGMSRSKT